jgi:hypothetical protein
MPVPQPLLTARADTNTLIGHPLVADDTGVGSVLPTATLIPRGDPRGERPDCDLAEAMRVFCGSTVMEANDAGAHSNSTAPESPTPIIYTAPSWDAPFTHPYS